MHAAVWLSSTSPPPPQSINQFNTSTRTRASRLIRGCCQEWCTFFFFLRRGADVVEFPTLRSFSAAPAREQPGRSRISVQSRRLTHSFFSFQLEFQPTWTIAPPRRTGPRLCSVIYIVLMFSSRPYWLLSAVWFTPPLPLYYSAPGFVFLLCFCSPMCFRNKGCTCTDERQWEETQSAPCRINKFRIITPDTC